MNKRKDEHIELAIKSYDKKDYFSDLRLIHKSIGSVNFDDIDLSTFFANTDFEFPIYINAMTGGTKRGGEINKALLKIARKTKILMCFGSISPILKNKSLVKDYKKILDENKGVKFAINIGSDKNYSQISEIVDILSPDILQVHVNLLQELLMPEGDRNFKNNLANIIDFQKKSKIPLIVKEVGFGMSSETVNTLINAKVKTIDISGYGGSNFAKIENMRRQKPIEYLNSFALSTLESMLDNKKNIEKAEILASGGVKNALDIAKLLILGAKSVGLSGVILKKLNSSGIEKTIEFIEDLKNELKIIMTLLGCEKIEDLKNAEYIVGGETYKFCKQRGVL